MGCPTNCTTCQFESTCNSAMYMNGCHFYPPVQKKEKSNFLTKIFGKIFK